MKKDFGMILFWFCLLLLVILYAHRVYGDVKEEYPIGPLGYNHWWVDMRGKGPDYEEQQRLANPPKQEPKQIVNSEIPKIVTKPLPKETRPFDLDKFAKAVARHETASCTKGYGKMYNNCFGMKNGRIAPCKKIGKNRMCIYATKEESYEAFKKVWKEGYGNKFPTLGAVRVYSGNDRANIWLANVTKFYNEQF